MFFACSKNEREIFLVDGSINLHPVDQNALSRAECSLMIPLDTTLRYSSKSGGAHNASIKRVGGNYDSCEVSRKFPIRYNIEGNAHTKTQDLALNIH